MYLARRFRYRCRADRLGERPINLNECDFTAKSTRASRKISLKNALRELVLFGERDARGVRLLSHDDLADAVCVVMIDAGP